MANEMNKKYTLVTGGTSGIGYELAKIFAGKGHNLILVARSGTQLHDVSAEFKQLGVDVLTIEKDLFQPEAPEEIYDEVRSRGIFVDVLVNDAGQGEKGKFHEVPLQRHIDIIQLDVTAVVALTRLFIDDMIANNEGKILNLASVVARTPAPEFSVYAASKAFILSFSQALAKEFEDSAITVTALMPGRTDTDFFYKAHMTDTKEYQEHELANPADVARDGYEALMSGESRVISGTANKLLIGMMNTMSDSSNASTMQKNMQRSPKADDGKKEGSGHKPSQKERASIGKSEGDGQPGGVKQGR